MNLTEYVIESTGLDTQRESPLLLAGDRWDLLPQLFNMAGFRVGAEIGVAGGRFSAHLCQTVANLKLYSIDSWTAYDNYLTRYNQAHFDRDYRKAVERLAPYNCEIVRGFSVEVAARVRDEALDFIYLDANRRFEDVWDNLTAWWPKIKRGGILSGCCYYNFKEHANCQVKDAVDSWTREYEIEPWFVIVHNRYPTYFWEKR